jgi:MFS family permease
MAFARTPPSDPVALPRTVWTLGFVSLLMDTSSEMIHSLLPLFMVNVLGASVFTVGVLEGVAESTALIVKIFSGTLSDRLGRRKPLVVLGYSLAALSKPAFALAPRVGVVIAARFADRLGKGIREAPRDAMLTDLTPQAQRGAAFGLRQALDTVGAVAGPLIAAGLMLAWAGDFRAIFWIAAVPALLSAGVLFFGVHEPAAGVATAAPALRLRDGVPLLNTRFGAVALVGFVFGMARFGDAFLVLRAQQQGVAIAMVPLVMVTMNIVYAATAFPFGKLADRVDPAALLPAGLGVLLLSVLALALGGAHPVLLIGVALWGLHMGMTQGLLAALVAGTAPERLRGTAFGVFNVVYGVATLLGSSAAGWLWDARGPQAPFVAGAALAVLALLLAGPCLRHARAGGPSGR